MLNPTALAAALLEVEVSIQGGPLTPEALAKVKAKTEGYAAAIQAYILQAVVTVPPGVVVATTGTAAAQAGATTTPGVGALT